MELGEYDKLEKVALRNMTIMELIEKMSEREEKVREHFDKVVGSDDNYPKGEIEEIAYVLATEKVEKEGEEAGDYETELDVIARDIQDSLTDMMDDLYMIRTQIRERLYAMGQTLYTEDFDGERVEDIMLENREIKEDVDKLKKHGHDGEIETGKVVNRQE